MPAFAFDSPAAIALGAFWRWLFDRVGALVDCIWLDASLLACRSLGTLVTKHFPGHPLALGLNRQELISHRCSKASRNNFAGRDPFTANSPRLCLMLDVRRPYDQPDHVRGTGDSKPRPRGSRAVASLYQIAGLQQGLPASAKAAPLPCAERQMPPPRLATGTHRSRIICPLWAERCEKAPHNE